MAESPATANDLTARSLRPLTPQEAQVGTVLLQDAWSIITASRPTVAARLDATPTDMAFRALIIQIQVAMVLRVLNNPDGKYEESGDDYAYKRDAAVSTGALYLSDAEAGLIGVGDAVSDGAWTIRPAGVPYGPGYWSDTTTWVPLA